VGAEVAIGLVNVQSVENINVKETARRKINECSSL
jgi:hypothetical protein